MPRLKSPARRLPPPVSRLQREREEPLLTRQLVGLVSASRAHSLRYAHLCNGASLKSIEFVQQFVDQLVASTPSSKPVEQQTTPRNMPVPANAPLATEQERQRQTPKLTLKLFQKLNGAHRKGMESAMMTSTGSKEPEQSTQAERQKMSQAQASEAANGPSEHRPSNGVVAKRRPGRPPGSKNKKPSLSLVRSKSYLANGIRKKRLAHSASKQNIEHSASVAHEHDNLANGVVKRRPGRPLGSKNKKQNLDIDQSMHRLPNGLPNRRPGRPPGSKSKKHTAIVQQATHDLVNAVPPKRRLGRPPGSKNKNKKPLVTAEQSTGGLPNGVAPKKRLGRPPGSKNKKPSATAQQSIHDLPNGVPAKRRGRPPGSKNKKSSANGVPQSKPDLSTNGIHKKRGRPPGSKNNNHIAGPERGLRARTMDQPEVRRRASRPPRKSFLSHRRFETGDPRKLVRVPRPVVAEPQPVFTPVSPKEDYDSDVSSDVILEIDQAYCIVCGGRNASEQMILCDACSSGCHTYCMRPARKTAPLGSWMCPTCFFVARKHVVPLPYMSKLRQGHCVICIRRRRFDKDQAPVKECSDCMLHFHRDCLRQYASDFAEDIADPEWICQNCREYHEEKKMWEAQKCA